MYIWRWQPNIHSGHKMDTDTPNFHQRLENRLNILRIIIFCKAAKSPIQKKPGLDLMCFMHTSTTVVTIMTWGLKNKLNRSHKNYYKSRSDHKATILTHSFRQTLQRSNMSWFYLYVSRTHFSLKARSRRSLWNFLSAKAKRYFIGFKNWQKIPTR